MTVAPSESLALDQLGIGIRAHIASIDWAALGAGDASRLRNFGFDEGVVIQAMHCGPIGRDPLAVKVGRMTVAIRRAHAAAVRVIPTSA
ncbi:FeoA family protein [Sphingomicrobium flavum]|uniref:FeoA family protein n=1 Tax=Sphingomicrobium flavum TaxID=1229164 RepID=UPI0021ADEC4D|nr:FeoA family protein [Sphingomicrobium flavum]